MALIDSELLSAHRSKNVSLAIFECFFTTSTPQNVLVLLTNKFKRTGLLLQNKNFGRQKYQNKGEMGRIS